MSSTNYHFLQASWWKSGWKERYQRAQHIAFRRKPVSIAAHEGGERLQRVLSVWDLIGIGIGCTIGAGIFVLTGVAANNFAGPGIVVSYFLAGFACIFSGLSYAEFSSRYPFAGSAYLYSYCAVGELMAWIVGWNLVLEYILAAAAVGRGWSSYLVSLLEGFGAQVPAALHNIEFNCSTDEFNEESCNSIDLLAGLILILMTFLCAVGTKVSSNVNTVMNAITISIILFVIIAGAIFTDPANWNPFFPFGAPGVFRGSAVIFFAYVGFDTVSTFAEETKNPKRDLPLGIIGTITISTLLYCGVALVLTGMVPYDLIDLRAPLSTAFAEKGLVWAQIVVAFGAFMALTTTILASLLGMPRIFFAMARDGLFFSPFSKISARFGTPLNGTLLSGFSAALLSSLLDIESLSDMVSIGTLLAFVMVNIAVLILRYQVPTKQDAKKSAVIIALLLVFMLPFLLAIMLDWHWAAIVVLGLIALVPFVFLVKQPQVQMSSVASFVCPLVPFVPAFGIMCNVYLMFNLGWTTWIRLIVWVTVGILLYLGYGIWNSKLNSMTVVEENDQGGSSAYDTHREKLLSDEAQEDEEENDTSLPPEMHEMAEMSTTPLSIS